MMEEVAVCDDGLEEVAVCDDGLCKTVVVYAVLCIEALHVTSPRVIE